MLIIHIFLPLNMFVFVLFPYFINNLLLSVSSSTLFVFVLMIFHVNDGEQQTKTVDCRGEVTASEDGGEVEVEKTLLQKKTFTVN